MEKVLELVEEEDITENNLQPTQLLVNIKACALNPVCYKMFEHIFPRMLSKNSIPELDFSGEVIATGEDVHEYKVGDRIFGLISHMSFARGLGVMTTKRIIDPSRDTVLPIPSNVSFQDAAGVPLAAMTAYECLALKAQVSKGQSVFINGGSGGVGTYAIQIARNLVGDSGTVITSCSAKNVELCKSLGANVVLDYTAKPIVDQLIECYSDSKFNCIFDTVRSPGIFHHASQYMHSNGRFLEVGFPLDSFTDAVFTFVNISYHKFRSFFPGGITYIHHSLESNQEGFRQLSSWMLEGKLRTISENTYKFFDPDQVSSAYKMLKSGRTRGKLIISME